MLPGLCGMVAVVLGQKMIEYASVHIFGDRLAHQMKDRRRNVYNMAFLFGGVFLKGFTSGNDKTVRPMGSRAFMMIESFDRPDIRR